jgi:hypothetical protein
MGTPRSLWRRYSLGSRRGRRSDSPAGQPGPAFLLRRWSPTLRRAEHHGGGRAVHDQSAPTFEDVERTIAP